MTKDTATPAERVRIAAVWAQVALDGAREALGLDPEARELGLIEAEEMLRMAANAIHRARTDGGPGAWA